MSRKPEPGIAEAAENAEVRIRDLQSRLSEHGSTAKKADAIDDLERQLQQYFSTEAAAELSSRFPLHQIRRRVVDGIADKILRSWEESQEGETPIEDEIVDRLVERIHERLAAARAAK